MTILEMPFNRLVSSNPNTELVITRVNASKLFELIEKPLHFLVSIILLLIDRLETPMLGTNL